MAYERNVPQKIENTIKILKYASDHSKSAIGARRKKESTVG